MNKSQIRIFFIPKSFSYYKIPSFWSEGFLGYYIFNTTKIKKLIL